MAEPQCATPPTSTSQEPPAPGRDVDNRELLRIAVIGAGTIGLSFAALHLAHPANRRLGKRVQVIIYDPRRDLKEYIEATLPGYLYSFSSCSSSKGDGERKQYGADDNENNQTQSQAGKWSGDIEEKLTLSHLLSTNTLIIASTLSDAVQNADIIQEQGPENIAFKQDLWPKIESLAKPTALFWSSTSGIPASVQGKSMRDPSRLLIVHPYNPPHVMPLLEIVPPPVPPSGSGSESDAAASNQSQLLQRTLDYWHSLNRSPVVLKEEVTGFVANRLAFALFREAVHLVNRGVATAEEIDRVVENSMGPRWAVKGPFWSYHAGGGKERGLRGFFDKIGDTVQACWDDAGTPVLKDGDGAGDWVDALCEQVGKSYGRLGEEDLGARDEKTRKVLDITMS